MPVMWCLANPKLGERQVLAALLEDNHHVIRHGQILLADKGFGGKEFKQLTTEMGLELTSAASASGSSRSTRPSRASSASKRTADALR
jgi:hypothetical protein